MERKSGAGWRKKGRRSVWDARGPEERIGDGAVRRAAGLGSGQFTFDRRRSRNKAIALALIYRPVQSKRS